MDYDSLRDGYDSAKAYDTQVEMENTYYEYSIAIEGIEATRDGRSKRDIDKEYTMLAKECLKEECKHLRWEILRLGDGAMVKYLPIVTTNKLYQEVKSYINLI